MIFFFSTKDIKQRKLQKCHTDELIREVKTRTRKLSLAWSLIISKTAASLPG